MPWCWVDAAKGIFGYCEVDRCDLVPTATTPLFTRKAGVAGLGSGPCKKNEFFCPSMIRYKTAWILISVSFVFFAAIFLLFSSNSAIFFCFSFSCRKRSDVCDGNQDCVEDEDENLDCQKFRCKATEFYCKVDKFCIRRSLVCDGARDCADGADEINCPAPKVNLKLFNTEADKALLNVSMTTYTTDGVGQVSEDSIYKYMLSCPRRVNADVLLHVMCVRVWPNKLAV